MQKLFFFFFAGDSSRKITGEGKSEGFLLVKTFTVS